MANKIEYIFSLRDQISAKLAGITATSDKTSRPFPAYRKKSGRRKTYSRTQERPSAH